MRKITFLLTLLLMYVGVTPMMAEFVNFQIDESKTYTIRIKDTQNYIYADSNNEYFTYDSGVKFNSEDTKFHFKFIDTGKKEYYSQELSVYNIKSVSTNKYASVLSDKVQFAAGENTNAYWFIEKEGDSYRITKVNKQNTWYLNSNTYWYPYMGEAIAVAGSYQNLVIEEVNVSGESGGNEGGGESGGNEGGDEVTIDYSLNSDFATAYHTNVNGRRFNNVTINGENVFQSNLNTTKIYHDATDKVINVEKEANIQVEFNYNGTWMNGYVYIDEDRNGFSAGLNGTYSPAGDLKSYSFYSGTDYSDGSGYNSSGSYLSGDYRSTLNPPSFKAPSTPGTYRMRLKIDWNSIDPKGDNNTANGTIKTNGGVIVDVTLVVTGPINLTLAQISDTDNLLYGLKGYIGSFSAPYATELPAGVDAYYATSKDNMGYITLTPCKATGTSAKGVPANFGVILVSESQNITMNPTSDNVDRPENAFDNSASEAVVMGDNCYVLANGDDGIGFYLATKGTTLKAGKAYIQLSNSSQTSALRLVLDETVTGINGVATEKADAPIYDLSGRRVLNTVKGGIYIQNGKKFIVK